MIALFFFIVASNALVVKSVPWIDVVVSGSRRDLRRKRIELERSS